MKSSPSRRSRYPREHRGGSNTPKEKLWINISCAQRWETPRITPGDEVLKQHAHSGTSLINSSSSAG
jgi:hypothetical protein